MPKLERNIEINAPSKKVWVVLTDRALIPKWNITVKEITELYLLFNFELVQKIMGFK